MNFESIEIAVLKGYIYTVAINKSLNVLACAGTIEKISIFDLNTNNEIQKLEKSNILPVLQLLFTNENKLIQLGFDNYITIYEHKDNKFILEKIIQTPFSKQHRYASLVCNEKSIISINDSNVIHLFDFENQHQELQVSTSASLTFLNVNNEQSMAIVGGQKYMYFVDIKNFRIKQKNLLSYSFYSKFSNNSLLYAQAIAPKIKIKCITSQKTCRKYLGDSEYAVLMIRFTKDDKYILSGGMDCLLQIYDVCYGNQIQKEFHGGYLFAIEFLNDDIFYTGGRDGKIGKWQKQL